MKKTIRIYCYLLVGLFLIGCVTEKEKIPLKGTYETELLYENFLNPSNTFRSYPFYSINDLLDSAEIYDQVADFKNAGFGGFYLHSRDGLLTKYLGKDWWKVIDAATESALANDLNVMYYDEDKWPSGFAGGIVPKISPSYRAKSLVRLKKDTPLPVGSKVLKEDEKYRYIEHTAQMGNRKFNGTAYVDLMNPKAVEQFIKVTYKPYFIRYSDVNKHHQLSIFSDEPHIHARYFDRDTPHEGIYSYSPYVRERFQKENGYDVFDKIELLFEEEGDWKNVRLNYYRAVARQFEESYTKQIANYCAAHGVRYTGHYLGEEKLQKVRNRIGNSMWHYRNMQIPGMDNLGLSIEGRLITARALASVANQYDIPYRMSELFGIGGQNMNFEDRKWIGGWHSIMGVNHFIPHLTLYSMKGLRKRDYPPTFSYHQPYWEYNKKIEAYLGRLSYMTTIGRYQPQLLVLYPLETVFAEGDEDAVVNNTFYKLLQELQALNYDYDLGDEDILSEKAKIEEGKLIVGAMKYEAVVLPRMHTMRTTTIKLLNDFIAHGGSVFQTNDFPTLVDGIEKKSAFVQLQSNVIKVKLKTLGAKLNEKITPNVIVENDDNKVFTQFRTVEDGQILQLYNTDHVNSVCAKVKAPVLEEIMTVWDPSNGECYKLVADKYGFFEVRLAPSSTLFVTSEDLSNGAPEIIDEYQLVENKQQLIELKDNWTTKREDPNTLTLDFASYSIDGGNSYSEPEPVIGIVERLSAQEYSGELHLKYAFQVDDRIPQLKVCVEDPSIFNSIQLNGMNLNFNNEDWFIDHSFKVSDISELFSVGKNEIHFSTDFSPKKLASEFASERYGSEIESIYLLGGFKLKTDQAEITFETQRNNSGDFIERPAYGFTEFAIASEDHKFTGDFTLDGYPFYAGAFMLTNRFNMKRIDDDSNYFIEFPNTEAIAMELFVNGNVVDTLVWAPFKADITEYLKRGPNEISVRMVNSLRNLLGPHHQQRAELTRTGPYSFSGTGGFPDPSGDNKWYDLRKQGEPMRLWTDTYYHIPFGFVNSPMITEIHN